MKKIIFLVVSIVVGILVYQKNNEIIIPSDAIRVRIIANSNNIEDMYQKKKLKDEIKNDLYKLVQDANSSFEADQNIQNNLGIIKSIVSEKTDDFKISYGINYFPSKVYKGIYYAEGKYQSLVITLGSGLGDNWWCVLYPPLCMLDDNDTIGDVEYRWFVKDLLEN